MALNYLKSRDPLYKLCPIFGVVHTTAALWLDYALEVLKVVVNKRSQPDFEVRWPTPIEMEESAALLVNNRKLGGLLKGIF